MKTHKTIHLKQYVELFKQLSPEAQSDALHYVRFLANTNSATPAKDRQELQRIQRYIENTELSAEVYRLYSLYYAELRALWSMDNLYCMIVMAFEFGRAKGYRAGVKSMRTHN